VGEWTWVDSYLEEERGRASRAWESLLATAHIKKLLHIVPSNREEWYSVVS